MNKKDWFRESEGSKNWEQREREKNKQKYRKKDNRREKDPEEEFLEDYEKNSRRVNERE